MGLARHARPPMRTPVLAAALLAVAPAPPPDAPAPTNVLLVVADDLGVDQLASYGVGEDLASTPTLDALAASGVRFTSAWSNPVCSTTRATILTGRYSFRTGVGYVVDSTWGLRASELTLPEALDRAGSGYAHAAFGKWHLSNPVTGGPGDPNEAGFSHYAGAPKNLAPYPTTYYSWTQVENGVATPATGYVTTRTVDDALAWIGAAPEPWFAWVAFHAPHDPFHTPPAGLYHVDLEGAASPEVQPRPYYKAMIEALDTELGRLLSAIGGTSNATVIFVGDNGTPGAVTVEPFPSEQAKGSAFQGGVHVPLLVAGPGVASGASCDALVSTVDLFATVVELAGAAEALGLAGAASQGGTVAPPTVDASVASGPRVDGISLVPYLVDPARPSLRETVFTEWFFPNGLGPPAEVRRAVRDRRYKYVFNDPPNPGQVPPLGGGDQVGREGLYDLVRDPLEAVNLLDQPALEPEEAAALVRLRRRLGTTLEGSSGGVGAPGSAGGR